jgi:uncharacterized protein YbjT (DUF2867 family)
VRALVRATTSGDKLEALRSAGAEMYTGDLKDTGSITAACAGVNAVISTASSTLSRQPGDSIQSVDTQGQVNLVEAAKNAGVDRFVFVSFRRPADLAFPLADAKTSVEKAIADLNFTIIQASFFMEVWLSPALGFDYGAGAARIYGSGTEPISWVFFRDVAGMCAIALRHTDAERQVIGFGGPEPVSPIEVVARAEHITGNRFRVEHVPEEALLSQRNTVTDPMEKSSAALTSSMPVETQSTWSRSWRSMERSDHPERLPSGGVKRSTRGTAHS